MVHFSLPPSVAAYNRLINGYQRGARKRGHQWDLTRDQAIGLMSGNCHYCGIPPIRTSKYRGNGDVTYNGIDRIDNAEGYILDNCVSCCAECNMAKGSRTEKDFLSWIKRVSNHQGGC